MCKIYQRKIWNCTFPLQPLKRLREERIRIVSCRANRGHQQSSGEVTVGRKGETISNYFFVFLLHYERIFWSFERKDDRYFLVESFPNNVFPARGRPTLCYNGRHVFWAPAAALYSLEKYLVGLFLCTPLPPFCAAYSAPMGILKEKCVVYTRDWSNFGNKCTSRARPLPSSSISRRSIISRSRFKKKMNHHRRRCGTRASR